jgi:2-dehydropantoate 2-reductase
VLGAGALGGYFGGRLLKGGTDVTFLVRPKRAAQLAENGLIVNARDGEIRLPATTVQTGQVNNPYDIILLCCKAYDLQNAIDAITPAVGPNTVVLPVLHGVRHISALTDRFGAERVLGGLTLVNAALSSTGEIVQSQASLNTISCGELNGQLSPRCSEIEKAFAAGGVSMTISDDIIGQMWGKFFAFTCSVTVAVIAKARAGVVATSTAGSSFVTSVIGECSHVVTAKGYPPPASMIDLIRNLWSQRGSDYGPSILVDMEGGRPTEGEHIIGDMVGHAAMLGVNAPILTASLFSIQSYELQRQPS